MRAGCFLLLGAGDATSFGQKFPINLRKSTFRTPAAGYKRKESNVREGYFLVWASVWGRPQKFSKGFAARQQNFLFLDRRRAKTSDSAPPHIWSTFSLKPTWWCHTPRPGVRFLSRHRKTQIKPAGVGIGPLNRILLSRALQDRSQI